MYGQEVYIMTNEITNKTINWDEAIESSVFISLKQDVPKELVITNWSFEKKPADSKIAPGKIELKADVLSEDGDEVENKLFTTTSRRLKTKLRPILENKKPSEKVKMTIIRVGEQFNTEYSVQEITDEEN